MQRDRERLLMVLHDRLAWIASPCLRYRTVSKRFSWTIPISSVRMDTQRQLSARAL